MEGWTISGQCSRCACTGELFWLRKSLVCRGCISMNIVEAPELKSPTFNRCADTATAYMTCPDCEEPDNLVHSVCIEGLDLLDMVKVSHVQYVEWIEHRKVVHGEQV